jgi:signal transduction histidine kinase
VSLRASPRADVGILIDVEAPGNRLSADERAALFAAFENAESARVLGSLGLGLTLARTLLRAHGGELEIEAAEGAEGTLFRMRLPAPAPA